MCIYLYVYRCKNIYIHTYIYTLEQVRQLDWKQCAPTLKKCADMKKCANLNLKRVRQLEKVLDNQQLENLPFLWVASDTFWSQSWISPIDKK